jgi:protoporphyrinogen oxidase
MTERVDVVVVGAGMAGLCAARHLTARGLSVAVLERDAHTGGRIQTERFDHGYLEHGGIFHTAGYAAMRRLLAEVGLADDAVAVPSGFYAAVRHEGAWKHLDYGSLLGPLQFPALSWPDRLTILKAAVPALLARPSDLGDLTTLAKLDTRSAATGLSARAASYFTAGPHEFLWGTPTDRLSYAMLAMQLHVFKGELREVRGGIGRLVEALAAGLDVRHGVEVTAVREVGDSVEVVLADGSSLSARGTVLACPADVSARLWAAPPAPVAAHLTGIDYSRIDYVYLRLRAPFRIWHRGRLVGMEVITSAEVGAMTMGGIYYANDWTTDGGGLLLVTAANAANAAAIPDDELCDRIQADVEKLHPEVVGQVTERVVMRHHPYTPTFTPGSIRRLAAARATLPAGRIDLAGDHMTAPWVEGAVRSGQLAAARLAGRL